MIRVRGLMILRRLLAVLGWSALVLQFYLSARLAVFVTLGYAIWALARRGADLPEPAAQGG